MRVSVSLSGRGLIRRHGGSVARVVRLFLLSWRLGSKKGVRWLTSGWNLFHVCGAPIGPEGLRWIYPGPIARSASLVILAVFLEGVFLVLINSSLRHVSPRLAVLYLIASPGNLI